MKAIRLLLPKFL